VTAVIFDLDGTLIDSAPDIIAASNGLLVEAGYAPLPPAQMKGFIGKGLAYLIQRLLEAVGEVPDGPMFAPMFAKFTIRYETAFDLTTVYPGVVGALEDLAGRGCALGICTNKPLVPTRTVLRHFDLTRHFGVVYGGDSLAVRKPDPAPLQAAAADMGRARVIFVGDSEVDAETAARAGVAFLLFTEGYRKTAVQDLPHRAAFNDFKQLPGLVAHIMEE
jgi:phosphoglycolate phosphatase